MKFFHLADLHLGKTIHGYSMIEMGDQIYWMEELLKKAEELQPDAVLISGDIYDRAVPSKEAVRLFDELLTRLAKLKIAVLMIAGNHDSGSRLAFADQLLRHQKIYIAGEIRREISHVTLEDSYGSVTFWLLPYFFPAAVNAALEREDLKDYDSAMRAMLENQKIDFSKRNILLCHQFVAAGGEKPLMGGSETTVGGIGQIDAAGLEGFDYVALGHIHRAQAMGKKEVRYAGSPLVYHFSELGQRKGLTVVEIREKGAVEICVEPLDVLHPMCEVRGTLEEIFAEPVEKNSYIKAVILQELLPPGTVEALRTHFEAKDCILMEIVREPVSEKKRFERNGGADIRNRSIEELFTEFYSFMKNGDLPDGVSEQLIGYTAELTRNQSGDETEKERVQSAGKLIAYAKELCRNEESDL